MTRFVYPVVLAILGAVLVVAGNAGIAEAGPETCYRCGASAAGSGGAVDVSVINGTSHSVPGRGTGSDGKAPGRTTWKVVEEKVVPACSGNGLNGPDALCLAALTCPADNLVRFWVRHKVTYWEAGPPERITGVDGWSQEPGSFCLGPDDPGITPIGLVIARIQSGFQSLPLPQSVPKISPAPSTLVNIPTRLEAGSAAPVTLTTEPLAGIVVTVTATPVEWRWTFGDGATAVTAAPRTTHEYRQAREAEASVRVMWTGTFTIPGSAEAFPIRTPAYAQGAPATVDVREARTELVRD
jgi:hypothetical protein